MDITIAYFHSLLRPDVVKRDFDQIRAAGASSIVYTIHEQEEQRWPRDLERGLRLAQDAGLKVYLSLGRYGNLFAGPSLVPSWYTFHNIESRVKDRHGRYHDISCFNHEPFRAWLCKEITYFVSNYPLYGILIDEPRHSDVTCFCSVCRALCPDVADLQRFRRRSMIDFLSEVCTCVKQADAHAKTAIVLLPKDLGQLEELAMLPDLDILGCHLFWSSLKQDVAQVEVWGQNVAEMARRYDKRSQLWLQNFNLDESSEQELKVAFKHVLKAEPDEVGCYYYWRNNVDPERVWQSTRGLLRHVPRRQLHWHTGSLPALSGKREEKHSL
ncbi:MAG: hypothetical protein H0W02_15030 [Ktedonobacteraceae bacterium]|nr:hypothetical protein [Ktedonobacteraceae bacterium]